MSGEYFSVQEVEGCPKLLPDLEPKENDCASVTGRQNHERKIIDIGEVEMAENRCNVLRKQLGYMKKMYQNNESEITQSFVRSKKVAEHRLELPKVKTLQDRNEEKTYKPIRQNSNAISTDTTGNAVHTINNILNGISNSVNRLSELHSHMEKKTYRESTGDHFYNATKLNDSYVNSQPVPFIAKQNNVLILDQEDAADVAKQTSQTCDIKEKDSPVLSVKSKFTTNKKRKKYKNLIGKDRISPIEVKVLTKKKAKSPSKETIRKMKIDSTKMFNERESKSLMVPKKSKRCVRRNRVSSRLYNARKIKDEAANTSHKLVELYHNVAAKSSYSDISNVDLNKSKLIEQEENKPDVPALQVEDFGYAYEKNAIKEKPKSFLPPIFEHKYLIPEAPRMECCSLHTRNYQLPTIASKLKQVARNYIRELSFHAIPFCAAKSITPSHNIGINIQQVMSIIKSNQPVVGISPTLAHNIGLAADKLQNKPFSGVMSSIGSRIGYKYGRSQCPLITTGLNFQQLEEMAKEIPEEPVEEDSERNLNGDNTENNTNGPCGDINMGNQQTLVWTVDPLKSRNCTCVQPQGRSFHHILKKFNSNALSPSVTSQMSQIQRKYPYRRYPRVQNEQILANKHNRKRNTPEKSNELKCKEKTLKEVLINLHDEFQGLNNRYVDLSMKVDNTDGGGNEATLKELDDMESSLNNKEEEIKMVMSLCKEVTALKQQIKTLKQRTSLISVSLEKHPTQSKFGEDVNPNTATHLTKLLKRIRMYQEDYSEKRDNQINQ